MRKTLTLKKRTLAHHPWFAASPASQMPWIPVLRRFGHWYWKKWPVYMLRITYPAVRHRHFSDADTREAAAFYSNLGPRNDRRYRGSY